MAGGVFINVRSHPLPSVPSSWAAKRLALAAEQGGGNITVTNNIILNGRTSQLLIYSYNRPESFGCPSSSITRNILSFTNTETDAERTGWDGGGVRLFGGNFLSASAHAAGNCPTSSVLRESDSNVFFNPKLGVNGTAQRGLFGSPGTPPMTLAEWRANRLTGIAPDAHSVIADPLFADAGAGDFTLSPSSPALALGFQEIPPIVAPVVRAHTKTDDAAADDDAGYIFFIKAPTSPAFRNVTWLQQEPQGFSEESFRTFMDALGAPTTNPKMKVGLTFQWELLDCFLSPHDCTEAQTEAGITAFLDAAAATNVPVQITLDTVQFYYQSNLWNWFDPAQPGFNPANVANVEWTGWGPENATRVAWRNVR